MLQENNERKTPLLHKNVNVYAFRNTIKRFQLFEVLYLSDKLSLSQKLCYFSEGAISQNDIILLSKITSHGGAFNALEI